MMDRIELWQYKGKATEQLDEDERDALTGIISERYPIALRLKFRDFCDCVNDSFALVQRYMEEAFTPAHAYEYAEQMAYLCSVDDAHALHTRDNVIAFRIMFAPLPAKCRAFLWAMARVDGNLERKVDGIYQRPRTLAQWTMEASAYEGTTPQEDEE